MSNARVTWWFTVVHKQRTGNLGMHNGIHSVAAQKDAIGE